MSTNRRSAAVPTADSDPRRQNDTKSSEQRRSISHLVGTSLLVLGVVVVALAVGVSTAAAETANEADGNDGTLELVENSSDEETVIVDLRTSATNVAGYQTALRYDSDVLSVASVDGVDLDDPITNDTLSGTVFITQSQTTGLDEPTLAQITFDIVGDGAIEVSFDANETGVNDANGTHLDVALQGFSVENGNDDDESSTGGGDGPTLPGPEEPVDETTENNESNDDDDMSTDNSENPVDDSDDSEESSDDSDDSESADDTADDTTDVDSPGFGILLGSVSVLALSTLFMRRE